MQRSEIKSLRFINAEIDGDACCSTSTPAAGAGASGHSLPALKFLCLLAHQQFITVCSTAGNARHTLHWLKA